MLAPICLFTYNRISELKQTIESLQQNNLSEQSELFIFSDGPKNELDKIKVEMVRNYIRRIKNFKFINIFESNSNKGLANSVIDGVSQIINEYGKVIVLEDDLITSANFLDFMNQALIYYEKYENIFSISGYTAKLKSLSNDEYDNYFSRRASSWGWATWRNRWDTVDWQVKDFKKFRWNLIQRINFNRVGSDLTRMLILQQKGKIDSWAIRWCYSQFKSQQLTVFPKTSKVNNIGIGKNSTNTKKGKRFFTPLDESKKANFKFNPNIILDNVIDKEFRNYYSLIERIKNRIM